MDKDVFWLKHDSNARHDPKITAMRAVYGYEGYGWYWAIIEMLREDANLRFPLTELQIVGLVKSLDTNIEMLKKYIQDCIDLELFYTKTVNGNQFLASKSLDVRMAKRLEIKRVRSIAGKKGNEKRWLSQKHRKTIANESQSIAIREEKKRQDSMCVGEECTSKYNGNGNLNSNRIASNSVEVSSRFAPPTKDQIRTYCQKEKLNLDIDKFVDFYASKGWFVGKSKMKDWQAAVRNWVRREAETSPVFHRPKCEKCSGTGWITRHGTGGSTQIRCSCTF